MRILDRSVYVGPSHYARFPVIRLELDLGELQAWPTGRLGRGFVDALIEALPGLAEHGCSYQEPGGFIRRMNEDDGTWLGHVLEHVALELQNVAGEDVTFGKTRSLDQPGLYSVVYEYAERQEGIAAGELALRLLCSLLPAQLRPAGSVPDDWTWPVARDAYIKYAQRRALGPSTASLVQAAEKRNIPWLRLNDQSLIQLGYGKYHQRIQATVTGRTPHISVELASDNEETNRILAALGLPWLERLEVVRQTLPPYEHKVRVALSRTGQLSISATPLSEIPRPPTARHTDAQHPIDSGDVFLYHKTSRRAIYDAARAARPCCDDVILWNERGEITESCMANVVIDLDGALITPPIECSLLGGTFREWLLDRGQIAERVIPVEMLRSARPIYLINSVRKWMEADLSESLC